MKTIWPNLGLGDAIILAGAVVVLAKRYGKVRFMRLPKNEVSVRSFFVDHPDIVVECVSDDVKPIPDDILVGWDNKDDPPRPSESFDQWFYRQLDIPLSESWDSCPLREAALACYQEVQPKEPYRFVHDDCERGFVINTSSTLLSIRPTPIPTTQSILRYAHMIENAETVWCIDSAFLHLTDRLKPKGKLYWVRTARPEANIPFHLVKLRHNWNIL